MAVVSEIAAPSQARLTAVVTEPTVWGGILAIEPSRSISIPVSGATITA
jgi:hypothetical protein